MYERFTERARQVVVLAQDEARTALNNYVGAEHILIGILREEEGLAARILASLDVTTDKVREGVRERKIGRVVDADELDTILPLTPRAKSILEQALRQALSLGHNYIGTEHVLLGLLSEGGNVAVEILTTDFPLTSEQIRAEVIRMLSGPKAPIVTESKSNLDRLAVLRDRSAENEARTAREMGVLHFAITLTRHLPGLEDEEIIKTAKALYRAS